LRAGRVIGSIGQSAAAERSLHTRDAVALEGQRCGEVLVIHDLTERTWAEEACKETQLRLTALLDSAMDGILMLDAEQRIVMCNGKVERMFGRTAGELVGRSILRILPDGLVGQVAVEPAPASDARATQTGHLGRLRGVRGNGEEFPIEASISEVEVRRQKFLTLTLRDMTERARVEEAFAESQERLRQSQKMAVVGHLTGGVVHDFNNLLTIIGGHAELLLTGLPSDAPMRDSLSQIRSASSKAASLTRQLLAFSRKQVVEPKILDLNMLVKDTEKMIRRLVGEDVSLQTVLAVDLNQVKVDPGQMDQVILNLVVNARDAMPKGGKLTLKTFNVALTKRTCPEADPGSYVALRITDSGCGMTSQVRARIFEPFFTTKSVGKGTGLGLTVVHGIVKQNGGSIVVDSKPGAGTTFTIYLPAAHGILNQARQVQPETSARGCETVLLVEDEETLRSLGAVVLESYGYNVLTAAGGQEALRLAHRHRGKLDLLLTDVVMPGINGCELAAMLRRRQPGLRVLFLSGYTEEDIVTRGIPNDGSAFLSKPFSPASLVTKIRQVLDAQSGNGSDAPTEAAR
jgi:PAS domain S-box-containing protein